MRLFTSRKSLFYAALALVSASALAVGCTDVPSEDGLLYPPGGDPPPNTPEELARLSHLSQLSEEQWKNAARDALLVDDGALAGIRLTPGSFVEFDTESINYAVGASVWDDMRLASAKVAAYATSDAGRLEKIAGTATDDPRVRANRAVKSVGRRAFRHALSKAEEATLMKVYDSAATNLGTGEDAFRAGLTDALSTIFQMPSFIYRSEFGTATTGNTRLAGPELATKLAFALWNTGPTDALLDAAENGELDTDAGYSGWVTRMLADAKAATTLTRFHGLLLGTSKIQGATRDAAAFPKSYAGMGNDMAEELTRFTRYIAVDEQEGGNWKALLTSRTAFVNQKLANLYDVPAPAELTDASKWAKVSLPEGKRAGMVTRAGVALEFSSSSIQSAIHRGKFIADRIAGISVTTAPMQIVVDFSTKPGKTNRERVESVTKGCGKGCHGNGRDEAGVLGPLGFALENYDPSGAFRDNENGTPVDASSTLPPFGSFTNAVQLMDKLAVSKDSHACYTNQWATYLAGRTLIASERDALAGVTDKSLAGAKVREIVSAIVSSHVFTSRKN